MRIYIVSLVAEAIGVQLGKWFDLAEYVSVADLEADIYHELTMFEYEVRTVDAPFKVDPRMSLEELLAIQEKLDDPCHGEAFELYANYQGDVQYALDYFDEAYQGEWPSMEDFAHDFLMEVDEEYRAAYESCRGWSPDIDLVAFHCDFTEIDGHIFQAV